MPKYRLNTGLVWILLASLVLAGNVLVAGISFKMAEVIQDRGSLFRLAILYAFTTGLLLILLGYYAISLRIIRPIRNLRSMLETAEPGPESDGSERMGEMDSLLRTAERLADRLDKQRESIREYSDLVEGLKAELETLRKEIFHTERLASVGRLAAGAAHEIGNPLAAVIGYTDLLLQSSFPEEKGKDFLKRISCELLRINEIVRDLLNFSRQSSGELEGVPVNGIITGSLSLLSHQKVMHYIDVRLDLEEKLPLALANAQQLRQVLVNILLNAADAMPIGGNLTIRSKLKQLQENDELKECVCIEIEDTGTGIRPDDLPRIFDPFFTTKPLGEGTGLGLPISLRIMESFGGRIGVESAIGAGTIFTLELKRWTE